MSDDVRDDDGWAPAFSWGYCRACHASGSCVDGLCYPCFAELVEDVRARVLAGQR